MGLPEAERGTDERQQLDGAQRITVGVGETPRVTVSMINGALRVLGDAETDAVIVRAVKPNGETVPVELVAELQTRLNGEIAIKVRPVNDIQRQIRRIKKSFDGNRFDGSRSEIFDNLGEMIDTLAAMKTLGNNVDRVRLEVTVPRRSDVALTTVSGAIQVGRIEGSVVAQSASGNIDCARVGGNLSVKSASGSLRLGDITGTVSVNTASGDVTMRGVDGNLVIQTLSGDAQGEDLVGQVGFKSHSGTLLVRESRLNGFYLNTTSGECLIEAALASGEYEVRTVSGDITLRPQPGLSAILSGRTVSGAFQCALPYQRSDEDWRAAMDDDDDEGSHGGFHGLGGFHGPEIDLPGLRIGKEGIDVGGFLRIDDEAVRMPGMRIDLHRERRGPDRQRERRRGRNRWEYLIGDPATAATGETRLRIRTVSGDVTLRPGRSDANESPRPGTTAQANDEARSAQPATAPKARAAVPGDGHGWPDSELWPAGATAPTPPTAATAPAPPTPPTIPQPPELPLQPETPTPPPPPELPTIPLHAEDAIVGHEGNTTPAASAASADTMRATAATEAGTDTEVPTLLPAPSVETPTPDATATSAAQERPTGDQTRLEILEALRGGEITTDEALLLLRQLDI
ncbi:MAG TPA: DUF4097 family beta strand repeat-containing protein [Thermomicrobiales bacterium]